MTSAPLDFRLLFESTPSPYLVLDTDLVVVAVNQAYLRATLTLRESLLGRPLFDAFPANPQDPSADGVPTLRQSLEAVLATGEPDVMTLQRYDIPADPGNPAAGFVERYWSPINTPVFDAAGRLTHIIHRVEDVTAFVHARRRGGDSAHAPGQGVSESMESDLFVRAREVQDINHRLCEANEELARVGAELRAQQEAKDRFIATLSHELRNPLAAAQVATELLALDLGEGHQPVAVLQRQLDALVRMTDDLLDATRARTGRFTVTRSHLDLRDVVRHAVRDAEPDLRELTVLVRLPDEPVAVDGDRVRLGQLLGNLLGNAGKYGRPGGTVEVALEVACRQAELTVSDDGIGFDPTLSDQLFEVFARAEPRAGADVGGLGLGLAIVRAVAELHGGAVTAASPGHGAGARFRVRLPLAGADVPVGPVPARPEAEAGGGRRVLVVEDNADLAASYATLLGRRGHEVVVATTGADGVRSAAEGTFDLVLSDIGLPDFDGWEVARRIRALPAGSEVTLIAVSGFGGDADRRASAEAGFDAHIAKPMRLSDLDEVWSPGAADPDSLP